MANDVTIRLNVDNKQAKKSVEEVEKATEQAAQRTSSRAQSMISRVGRTLATATAAFAGSAAGAAAGRFAGGAARALGQSPFTPRAFAVADLALQPQDPFTGTSVREAATAIAPSAIARFDTLKETAGTVTGIAQQLGRFGIELSKDEVNDLFQSLNAADSRGAKAASNAAHNISGAKAIGDTVAAVMGLAGETRFKSPDQMEAGQGLE